MHAFLFPVAILIEVFMISILLVWMRRGPHLEQKKAFGINFFVATLTLALLFLQLATPETVWQHWVSPDPPASNGRRTFSPLFIVLTFILPTLPMYAVNLVSDIRKQPEKHPPFVFWVLLGYIVLHLISIGVIFNF